MLRKCFRRPVDASNALYMYLTKLRTGRSNENIANEFNLTKASVGRILSKTREALMKDFVPQNVRFRSREEMLRDNTLLSTMLLAGNNPHTVIQIFDGTYIYIQKSTNASFQKLSFNSQKNRNYVKPMMCVAPDGYIEYIHGPYPATLNDAKILNKIFDTNPNAFANLQENDVIVGDRAFRDTEKKLSERKLILRIPESTKERNKNAVLTRKQANQSRIVTKIRFIVEVINGRLKMVFKIFSNVWSNLNLPHLQEDLLIAAAILNKYFSRILSDIGMEEEIGKAMLERLDTPNILYGIVKKRNFQKEIKNFVPYQDNVFPRLEMRDLIMISLGTYQIKLAPTYYAEHMKLCNNEFLVYVCPEEGSSQFCNQFYTETNSPRLLCAKMKSRHKSQTSYHTYVLFDAFGAGSSCILSYYCECKTGRRTVGCCAHQSVK